MSSLLVRPDTDPSCLTQPVPAHHLRRLFGFISLEIGAAPLSIIRDALLSNSEIWTAAP